MNLTAITLYCQKHCPATAFRAAGRRASPLYDRISCSGQFANATSTAHNERGKTIPDALSQQGPCGFYPQSLQAESYGLQQLG